MRPILVGESNPYSLRPELALWPDPPGCSGWRLCHVVLGMDETRYLRAFDRANLCAGAWSKSHALARADKIRATHRVIIALGAKVSSAFSVPFEPFRVFEQSPHCTVAVLPHPSGLCRIWNDARSIEGARLVVASLLDAQVVEGS